MMREKRWTLKIVGKDSVAHERYVSADSAKTQARNLRRWMPERNLTFHIYDPQGEPYQHSIADDGARMRWQWSTSRSSAVAEVGALDSPAAPQKGIA